MIRVLIIDDLFDRTQRLELELPVNAGASVMSYVPEKYRADYRITLNDRDLTTAEAHVLRARDDDLIHAVSPRACIQISGYGVIAVIDVIAKAWIAIGPVGQAIVTAAVLAGISYGIQALIMSKGTGAESDTINGFDVIQPTVASGVTIPVIYGEHRVSGHLIDYHTELDRLGDERGYFLFALGYGRIDAISGETGGEAGELDDVDRDHAACATVEIDGNPIKEYEGISLSFRAGEVTQSVIRGFQVVNATRAVGIELEQPEDENGDGAAGPGSWHSYTTDAAVDAVSLKFLCPLGLYAVNNDNGSVKDEQVFINVRYRQLGTTAWTYLVSDYPWDEVATVIESQVEGLAIVFERLSLSPTNLELKITFSARAIYEIECRRRNVEWYAEKGDWFEGPPEKWKWKERDSTANRHHPPNKINLIQWEATEQTTTESLAHPGLALVGIKALASDQLNGSLPRCTWIVKGCRVRVWDGVDAANPAFRWEWSNNPAWVALDILTHEDRGLGAYIPMSQIDLVSFKAWADFCDELVYDGQSGNHKRCTFDGVFDNQTDGWQAFLEVCATSRASASLWGDKIGVKIERARSRTQLFGDGNIIRGSFTRTFIDPAESPNAIVAQFRNADNDYEPDAIQVESDSVIQSVNPLRSKTLQMRGVTREAQAYREAKFALLMLENVRESVEFQCGLDALVAEPGDLIGVSRDIPSWGASGRVAGGGTSTIALEESVTIGSAPTEILLARSNGTIESRQIYFGSTPPGDYAAGATLTVTSPWTGLIPQVGDTYAIGELNKSVRDYVVQEITTTSDLTRKIRAYEYPGNPALAAADGAISIDVSPEPGPAPPKFPPDVTSLVARESYATAADGHVLAAIDVFWQWGRGYAQTPAAAVYVRNKGGGRWRMVGLTFNTTIKVTQDVRAGEHYAVAVISLNAYQAGKKPNDAPKASVFVTGRGVSMRVPVELYPTVSTGTLGIAWDELGLDEDGFPVNRSVARYEVRRGGDWRTAFVVADSLRDGATVADYFPGADKLLVRAIDRAGNVSAKVASVDTSISVADSSRIAYQQSEGEAGWPGVKGAIEVDSLGRLVLSSGFTTGFYVSQLIDLGSLQSWDVSIAQSIVQRHLVTTSAMVKISIGAINGPYGYFETGEIVRGQTSGAVGYVAARRYDGDPTLYITPLSGTFASGEVIAGDETTSRVTTSSAQSAVTYEDDIANGIIDAGGPVGETHLTSATQRSRVVLSRSADNVRFVDIDDFSRGIVRARYIQVQLYLATDDAAEWAPACEKLELAVLDPSGEVLFPQLAA